MLLLNRIFTGTKTSKNIGNVLAHIALGKGKCVRTAFYRIVVTYVRALSYVVEKAMVKLPPAPLPHD